MGASVEPITRDDADPADLALQVVVQLRRLGRATPRIGPHPREDRLLAGRPLGSQVGEMERRARAGQGHVLPGQEPRGCHRVEGRRREQGAAGEQGGHEPADAADVGEGEDQGRDVLGGDLEAFGHGQSRGHDREVGVRGAFRVGRRPRRVEEPPHRRIGGPGRYRRGGRKERGVAVGQLPVDDQHLEPRSVGRQFVCHGLEVEVAVDGRHDEQGGTGSVG